MPRKDPHAARQQPRPAENSAEDPAENSAEAPDARRRRDAQTPGETSDAGEPETGAAPDAAPDAATPASAPHAVLGPQSPAEGDAPDAAPRDAPPEETEGRGQLALRLAVVALGALVILLLAWAL